MPTKSTGSRVNSLIKCADTYSVSTGITLTLINSYGDTLYQTKPGLCRLCQKASGMMKERLNCSKTHLYGSYQAERFGGKYIFFCKLGLTHWVTPVILDDNEKGSLVAGPVLMIQPDDFLLEEILLQNLSEDEVQELKHLMDTISVVSPERVDQLSNLLFMVVAYGSGEGASYFSDEREMLEQQSNISEYIHHIKTFGGQSDSGGSYPIDKEKELLSLISSGDKTGAQKVLNELLGAIFFSSGSSFEVVKARVLELIVVLSRAALEGGADIEQIFGLNYGYINEIHKFTAVEEMTVWLSKILGRFTDCVFVIKDVKHADVIYKALDFIRKNYMKKISLEDVAASVYLSPPYFSKIFKEETGTNFITYLNDYRIHIAKRLLMDNSIDLVDISSLVGYEDQSYFSKSFKKLTGMTPGRFRDNRGLMASIKNGGR